jgi:hypothetical protein
MGEALHGSLIDSQAAELPRCDGLDEEALVADIRCSWSCSDRAELVKPN